MVSWCPPMSPILYPERPGIINYRYRLHPLESRDILIENNLIDGPSKPGIYLSCVDGARVRGNRSRHCQPALRIEYAKNVECTANDFGAESVVIGQGCDRQSIIIK